VEFFGGTVNAKWVSVLFCGDDGIDTDEGYQGKIQFAFIMVGTEGHHALEMDSKTNNDVNSQPRSFPQVYNMLIVGGDDSPSSASSDDQELGLVRLREGTGGEFGNIIVANVGKYGVLQNECGAESRTHTKAATGNPNSLWFSPNNIIRSPSVGAFNNQGSCANGGLSESSNVDPQLMLLPSTAHEDVKFIDPRPKKVSNARISADTPPRDGFFDAAVYRGAFDTDLWLSGWSWLSDYGRIPDNVAATSSAATSPLARLSPTTRCT